MKRFWQEVGVAILLGMVLPGIILRIAVWSSGSSKQNIPMTEETVPSVQEQIQIPVLMKDGSITEIDLDSYLTGVVLAEMPASFELEALKAQAVVARTYTMRAYQGKSKHESAAICTDSACCQAYRTGDDYLNSGGTVENFDKVSSAVKQTSGLVLMYEGELIEATYFSCSGGSTEDAVAVWGTDVPYLKATDSPGEEAAAHFSDSVTFTAGQLQEALGLALEEDPTQWFGDVTYTSGGGVAIMEVGGKAFTGTELRRLLNLRSTAFRVEIGEETVTVHTRGYGHRVGMSQYGADAMAASGSSCQEILAHYYQGTSLEQLSD